MNNDHKSCECDSWLSVFAERGVEEQSILNCVTRLSLFLQLTARPFSSYSAHKSALCVGVSGALDKPQFNRWLLSSWCVRVDAQNHLNEFTKFTKDLNMNAFSHVGVDNYVIKQCSTGPFTPTSPLTPGRVTTTHPVFLYNLMQKFRHPCLIMDFINASVANININVC